MSNIFASENILFSSRTGNNQVADRLTKKLNNRSIHYSRVKYFIILFSKFLIINTEVKQQFGNKQSKYLK